MPNLITPDGTLSFPHLFTPRMPPNPQPQQKPRFQTVLLIPRELTQDDKDRLTALKKACLKILQEKWGDKTEGMLKIGSLRWPFNTKFTNKLGENRYDPEKWQCYIQPWTTQPVGIVSRYRGADGKPMKITDASEIYPGAIARLSVNPFYYDSNGNWGVALGLNNVQKRGDGERIDNRRSAQDEFDGEDREDAEMPTEPSPAIEAGGAPVTGKGLADLFT